MDILLIEEDGSKVGNVSLEQARQMALERGKDLVRVSSQNVYRIADEGRIKYEKKKRKKQSLSSGRSHKVKEIKIKYATGDHDLEIKSDRAAKFIKKGHRVKVTLELRGAQKMYGGHAMTKTNTFIKSILSKCVGKIDKPPASNGSKIISILTPA